MKQKALKKKLDRLLQLKHVPLNPKCLVCGDRTSEMHHYIKKSHSNNLRYDKNNIVPLCKVCHCKHHISGDPRIHQVILKKKGHAWAEKLEEKRRVIFKDTLANLEGIRKELERS